VKTKIFLSITLLLFSYVSLAQVPEHLKISARGMGEAGVLSARATGSNVFSAANLRRVGGVMFQGVLEDESFLGDVKSVSIERKGDIGLITFTLSGNNKAFYEAPYWLLGPTINYALSDDNAVVSLFGKPTDSEINKISSTASEYMTSLNFFYSYVERLRGCMETTNPSPSCVGLSQKFNEDEFDEQSVNNN